MLSEIINLLKSPTILSVDDIAQKLNVDKDSVIIALEQLKRMGYIKDMKRQSCEGESCKRCSGCGNNTLKAFGSIYSFYDKNVLE